MTKFSKTKIKAFFKSIIKIITFIDLEIKRKFLLFGGGTFFWFLLITVISISSLYFSEIKFDLFIKSTIPQIQISAHLNSNILNIEKSINNKINNKDYEKKFYLTILKDLKSIEKLILDSLYKQNSRKEKPTYFFNKLFNPIENLDENNKQLKLIIKSISKINTFSLKVYEEKNSTDSTMKEHITIMKKDILDLKNISIKYKQNIEKSIERTQAHTNIAIDKSITLILSIFAIASLLLLLFTKWLTDAFVTPIKKIIKEIKLIRTGKIVREKVFDIKSKDEIGQLSREFNHLVDNVYGIAIFKKIIEEDTNLEEVYTRLGKAFEAEANMKKFNIHQINEKTDTISTIYPLVNETPLCNSEIFHNCQLCRSKKTAHKISSFDFDGICPYFEHQEEYHHICIPMNISGNVLSVFQFIFDKKQTTETKEEIEKNIFKVENYISNSLSVIETKKLMASLKISSLEDELTGLYNRRFLQENSKSIIAKATKDNLNISLLMCDMDYFKKVNDTYGHNVGDDVLKLTSKIIQENVQKNDYVIRFGGEEFLVLSLSAEKNHGLTVATKIRKAIEENIFTSSNGKEFKKTISIGISEYPKDSISLWENIKYADVALYKAKEDGRNIALRFDKEMWKKSNF